MFHKFRHFLHLVRFSHTLFAMPFALASMVWAADGWPGWKTLSLIVLCLVTCRNAAMSFNRFVDADIDAQNPRTAFRHIPAGILKRRDVAFFFAANSAIFIFTTWFINSLAFYLAVPTLFAVCFYSFTKRFTSWSHLFLGLAIGISPVGAWIAVRGSFGGEAILLCLSLMLWIAGFDIIYATQDREFDTKAGLNSLVVRYGQAGALKIGKVLHLCMLGCMMGIEMTYSLGIVYRVAIGLITLLLVYLHFFRRSESLDSMNKDFFLANSAVSLAIFLGITGAVVFRRWALILFAAGIILVPQAKAQGWAPLNSGTTSVALLDVQFLNENTGYAVGNLNTLLATHDGGATWVPRNTGLTTSFALYSLWFTDAATGYVVGSASTLRKSVDSGNTWVPQISTTLILQLNAIHFANATRGCAVGREVSGGLLLGAIYCTNDAGSQWVSRSLLTRNLNAVEFADTNYAFIAGDTGTFLRSTDGGVVWTLRSSGAAQNLNGIHFSGPAIGWIVGSNGTIIKTLDSGLTWSPQISNTTRRLNEVFFRGPDTGYVVGDAGVILKTFDGGANWIDDGFGSVQGFYGIHFPVSGTGYIVGSTGTILKTSPTTMIRRGLPGGIRRPENSSSSFFDLLGRRTWENPLFRFLFN